MHFFKSVMIVRIHFILRSVPKNWVAQKVYPKGLRAESITGWAEWLGDKAE